MIKNRRINLFSIKKECYRQTFKNRILINICGVIGLTACGSTTPALPKVSALETQSVNQFYSYCESCVPATKLQADDYKPLEPDVPSVDVASTTPTIVQPIHHTQATHKKHIKHHKKKHKKTHKSQCLEWSK